MKKIYHYGGVAVGNIDLLQPTANEQSATSYAEPDSMM